MLFESTWPVAAGYFQCNLSTALARRDPERQAGLLYVTSGQGEWTVGAWKFPVQRGDLMALPREMCGSARLEASQPFGYYYVYFEGDGASLRWPWDLGPGPASIESSGIPCAGGPFRPEIAGLFRQIQDELSKRHSHAASAARAHLSLLGIAFARMLTHPLPSYAKAAPAGKPWPEPIALAADYVHSHLDRDLALRDLARVARYSERRLVQIFRRVLGLSPMAYVRERRIREAQRLLASGELSIKEVAGRLNFSDAQHFSRVFRRLTGITPTQYAAGETPTQQRTSGQYAVWSAGR